MNQSKTQDTALYAIYILAVAVSISIWLIAIRAPLWIDEAGSYWQISAGFSQILPRNHVTFPAYVFILWFFSKILGTSEIALRIPSLLAMLGAVYLLYLAARELFERDVAIIAAVIFCLHPIIVFESIDARPYAFGALAINATILILLRLRHNNSNWLAALFGFSAACILYFHYLFAVILPAFVICFFIVKIGDRKALWRQFSIATAVFILAFLPVIPGLHQLFHSSGTHVYQAAPKLSQLFWTLAPGWLPFIFIGIALVALVIAALTKLRSDSHNGFESWRVIVCASLALIPILTLFGLSTETHVHMFVTRYRMAAIPGIALCWALLVNLFPTRALRLLFCVAFVAATAFLYGSSPTLRSHSNSWKDAIDFVQKNASADNAPVLICSDLIEADYTPMPLDSPKDSVYFPQLSYYKLSVPVVPLPPDLNSEAIRVGSQFLAVATQEHTRFLAAANGQSSTVLAWLSQSASAAFDVHNLGAFDGVEVLEFTPKTHASPLATPPLAHSSDQPSPRVVKAASKPATP